MIATIIFCLLFTLAFYLHEKYRIQDEQTADVAASASFKTLWHRYKGFVQMSVYAYVFYMAFMANGWLYAIGVTLFFASFFWMFHDGLLNSFLFKKEWWFVGTTAGTDKALGRTATSIFKVFFLVASIVILIVWMISK